MSKVYEQLMKNGYYAVPYAHHSKQLKAAIKAAGFRPMAKECFANAQKLVTRQNIFKLKYVEGIVRMEGLGIPFEHAWVADQNKNYDITLNPIPSIICQKEYTPTEVFQNMRKTMLYTSLNHEWLETMKMAVYMNIPVDSDIKFIKEKIQESFSILKKLNSKV